MITAFVVAATLTLLLVVLATYQPPAVPAMAQMEKGRSAAPRLHEKCETSNGGGHAPTTSCWWHLSLDGDTWLSWPWTNPTGDVGRVDAHLRASAPITVTFWRGKVFEIVTNDGHVYVDYDDAVGAERSFQLAGVWLGVMVAAASTANIGLGVWLLYARAIPKSAQELPVVLYGVILVGGLLSCLDHGRVWWGVPGLALFSAAAGLVIPTLGDRSELGELE